MNVRRYEGWVVDVADAMYEDGFSFNQIAAELDVPAATLRFWRIVRRLPVRDQEEARLVRVREGLRGTLAAREEELRQLHARGATLNESARQLGASPTGVSLHFRRW